MVDHRRIPDAGPGRARGAAVLPEGEVTRAGRRMLEARVELLEHRAEVLEAQLKALAEIMAECAKAAELPVPRQLPIPRHLHVVVLRAA